MDTVRLSRSASPEAALFRQPDDHVAGPASSVLEHSPADAADYERLAAVIFAGQTAIDPGQMIQTGPADRPLTMPIQELRPAWFKSFLEILGFASWQHPTDHGMIRGDA